MTMASSGVAPLQCDALVFSDNCAPLTLTLAPGQCGVVHVCDEESADLLLQTLLGLQRPTGGERLLFGANPEALTATGRHTLRRRVGVVADHCGLISNLTVLENLLLPAEYAGQQNRADLAAAARGMLRRVGYQGDESRLPGHLKLMQKRQLLLARALFTSPEFVLYGTFLSGLSARERVQLLDLALAFHSGAEHGAALFLTSDASFAARLGAVVVCNLIKGESNER